MLQFHRSNRDPKSWEGLAQQLAAAGIKLLAEVEFSNGAACAEQLLIEARKKDSCAQLWPEFSMNIIAADLSTRRFQEWG